VNLQRQCDKCTEPKVDSSPNVFLENIHAARKLETTYYTTNRKQLTDFFWYRESGIRVNIGLQSINIVPLYEDINKRTSTSCLSMRTSPMTGTMSSYWPTPTSALRRTRFDKYSRHNAGMTDRLTDWLVGWLIDWLIHNTLCPEKLNCISSVTENHNAQHCDCVFISPACVPFKHDLGLDWTIRVDVLSHTHYFAMSCFLCF